MEGCFQPIDSRFESRYESITLLMQMCVAPFNKLVLCLHISHGKKKEHLPPAVCRVFNRN